jgi:exodeoxyribonuclease III
MDIVTWNVNSLRVRLPRVLAWLEAHQPDVLCLQETKVSDDQFPRAEVEALGYQVATREQSSGRTGLNGVAILSRQPLEDVVTVLPGNDEDDQARFIAARTGGVDVVCVYVPNGQAVGVDAFFYKLDWLSRLQAFLVAERDPTAPLALLGDFNITPDDRDVYDPIAFKDRLHATAHERRAIGYLETWGLRDALRVLHDDGGHFSWWDYRDTTQQVREDQGLRIDLILITEPLVQRLRAVSVDVVERRGEQLPDHKPSDHAPVTASFD